MSKSNSNTQSKFAGFIVAAIIHIALIGVIILATRQQYKEKEEIQPVAMTTGEISDPTGQMVINEPEPEPAATPIKLSEIVERNEEEVATPIMLIEGFSFEKEQPKKEEAEPELPKIEEKKQEEPPKPEPPKIEEKKPVELKVEEKKPAEPKAEKPKPVKEEPKVEEKKPEQPKSVKKDSRADEIRKQMESANKKSPVTAPSKPSKSVSSGDLYNPGAGSGGKAAIKGKYNTNGISSDQASPDQLYFGIIDTEIKRRWNAVAPNGLSGNPSPVVVSFNISPSGMINSFKIVKRSNWPAMNDAAAQLGKSLQESRLPSFKQSGIKGLGSSPISIDEYNLKYLNQ